MTRGRKHWLFSTRFLPNVDGCSPLRSTSSACFCIPPLLCQPCSEEKRQIRDAAEREFHNLKVAELGDLFWFRTLNAEMSISLALLPSNEIKQRILVAMERTWLQCPAAAGTQQATTTRRTLRAVSPFPGYRHHRHNHLTRTQKNGLNERTNI